jgi:hypothetical protein
VRWLLALSLSAMALSPIAHASLSAMAHSKCFGNFSKSSVILGSASRKIAMTR